MNSVYVDRKLVYSAFFSTELFIFLPIFLIALKLSKSSGPYEETSARELFLAVKERLSLNIKSIYFQEVKFPIKFHPTREVGT